MSRFRHELRFGVIARALRSGQDDDVAVEDAILRGEGNGMAEAPKQSIWDYVAAQVAQRFGLEFVAKSPSLQAIIGEGSRYVKVEARGIWFDTRSLTLGLLAAGARDKGRLRSFAGLTFREWAEGQVTKPVLSRALKAEATPVQSAQRFMGREASIHVSASVKSLIVRSGELSRATIESMHFDGRHLFAAMIEKGSIADQMRSLFGKAVADDEIAALMQRLIKEISTSSEAGGTIESWQAALGRWPAPPPPPPPPPPEPGPQGEEIIRFSHDGARNSDDVLETKRDVEALAKLICLNGSTPLAVAIFGGWGSGKTTFMSSLDEKVDEIARNAAECVSEGDTPFVSRVVQIKFNAWQFVDANLWASLTAEFFDQLRAGGWRRAGTVRHAGLVEKVNSHVHSLTADAAEHRAAVVESNRQVLEAQEARDKAAKAVRDAKTKVMGHAAMETLGEIYEGQKANLRAMGVARGVGDPTQGIEAVIEAVRSSRSIVRRGWTTLRMVWRYRAPAAMLGAALLTISVAGFWLYRSEAFVAAGITTAFAALGSFAAFWRAAAPAVRFVNSVAQRGADLARSLNMVDEVAVKELMGKEALLRDATREAEARARVAERADRNLARYVDPVGPSNPPRLLRYVLEDDPETKAFEEQIGLIGRARRLFQAVNDIIVRNDGESPQRIVLYIDDLDRCTKKQVYDVLQAIHLLLAFESFAVVVGVDVKRIEGALAAEFAADGAQPLTEFERRQHAVHYLEKIFQVAFWLDPLTSGAGGSFGAFVKSLTRPEPERISETARRGEGADNGVPDGATAEQAVEIPPPVLAAPPQGKASLLERVIDFFQGLFSANATVPGEPLLQDERENSDDPAQPPEPDPDKASPRRDGFRTLEIDEAEIDFLASPEIAGLAGSTPRSVKRLVNVYRLVRSRLADGGTALLGRGVQRPNYPLVALATAIETGQPVAVAAAFMSALGAIHPDTQIVTAPASEADPLRSGLDMAFEAVLAHQFDPEGVVDGTADLQAVLRDKCPGLIPALIKVHGLRNGNVTAAEVLRVVRLARRFSFNRYH